METVEVRRQGYLPTTIKIRPSERLNRLAEEMAEHSRTIGELEKQIQTLEVEAQRLDQSENFSLETSQRSAEIKRQLATLERQLTEHQAHRTRVADERSQWVEQIATKEFLRRILWQEYPSARPGPVSDWSRTKMYNFGEREQRTRGDVLRDLQDTISWLIRFGGEDSELQRELAQLSQQAEEERT